MPHNLYLHSSLVLTRKIEHTNKNVVREACIYNSLESSVSLFVSFIINFAIVGTFAYYHFHDPSIKLNLMNASDAFALTFGNASSIIWGVGLLAAG